MQVEMMFSKIAMGLPFQSSRFHHVPTDDNCQHLRKKLRYGQGAWTSPFFLRMLLLWSCFIKKHPPDFTSRASWEEAMMLFFTISGEVSTSKVCTSAEILGWRPPQFHPIQGIRVVHLPRISSRFPLILTGSRKFRWYHPMIIPIIHQRRFDLNAHIIRYTCWNALIDPIYINLYI